MKLLDRFDDWVNPIVVKELRQAVRGRVIVSALYVFLFLQVLILGITLYASLMREERGVDFQAGRTVFMILQGVLLGSCMILIPSYAGVRLGAERLEPNPDLLFISSLKPRAIVFGKFCAALLLAVMIFGACAPFLVFTYLLRGIDIPTIVVVLAFDFLAVAFATMVSLFLASTSSNRGVKMLMGAVGAGGLTMVFFGSLGTTIALSQLGVAGALGNAFGSATGSGGEVAALLATLTLLIGLLIGLFYAWSVSLLNPPSSNRALPARAYTVGAWLLGGVVAMLWCRDVGTLIPLFVWMVVGTALGVLQLLIGISERDCWGPRVTRQIPRGLPGRALAFLFYSGSAGGVLLGMLMLAGTILTLAGWAEAFPKLTHVPDMMRVYETMTVIVLYALCYTLSAALVRRLAGTALPAAATWLLALTLLFVGCALSAVYGYMVLDRYSRHVSGDFTWWLLPNPFASVAEMNMSSMSHQAFVTPPFYFTTAWAIVVFIANMPWFIAQWQRFQTHLPKEYVLEEVKPAEGANGTAGWTTGMPGAADAEPEDKFA